ncbi:DivIVA domain-containing protein [Spiractinospora alimapuensis]|uniref:DivIVA domain-containing protein n=1 Tax=Spiractinospora alimapuensis TaxID=2820884 RepID=UPI001F1E4449|nr:DivIVA domain-containing protein [Spiractinospora alimapuensis]QVQ53126.1 DivIVA domain-containing protein [Spiractinospora alimapuensis]
MPLTPADVRNKQFSTTRLRPGYDEEEVDAFLDEVEAELDRLIQENEELRGKLAEALRGKVPPMSAQDMQSEPQAPPEPVQQQPQPQMQVAPEPPAQPQLQQPAPEQALAGMAMGMQESGDSMDTASRVLALAQQTADQAISDARREADETLGRARHEAEDILGKARRQAEQIVNEARARSENLDRDAQERHRQVMGSLVQQRDELEHRVNTLKDFEREYRSRLKDYFERQLRELAEGAQEPASNTGSFQQPSMAPATAPSGPAPALQPATPAGGAMTGGNPFAQPEPVQQPAGYHPSETPHEHR